MKPHLQLHISVALFGLAGIFARWIPLDPLMIVWARVVFACLGLLPFIVFGKRSFPSLDSGFLIRSALLGGVLAFHWFSFFKAIQETSVALALLSFASFPLFTLLLEAITNRKSLSSIDFILVLISLLGTALILPWDSSSPDFSGVIWGLLSGLSFAVMTILNQKLVQGKHPLQIAFFQDLWAAILLSPLVYFKWEEPSFNDWLLFLILGLVFTALSHSLFIAALRKVAARTAALVAALEPLYGIIAAYILFAEKPATFTILGGTLILGAGLWAQFRDSN